MHPNIFKIWQKEQSPQDELAKKIEWKNKNFNKKSKNTTLLAGQVSSLGLEKQIIFDKIEIYGHFWLVSVGSLNLKTIWKIENKTEMPGLCWLAGTWKPKIFHVESKDPPGRGKRKMDFNFSLERIDTNTKFLSIFQD